MNETMMTGLCPHNFVQLEMVSEVPELEPDQRVTWKSSGKQRFIHRIEPKIAIEPDGHISSSEGAQVVTYEQVPDFRMSPRAVAFCKPEHDAVCILERVVHDGLEQFAPAVGLIEIFILALHMEPLAIAWPTFDEDSPLELTFRNPMERKLPSFSLSFFLSVPADFAEHWRP